jgi:hypothetical protein
MPVPAPRPAEMDQPVRSAVVHCGLQWYAKLVRTRPLIVALFDQAIRHSIETTLLFIVGVSNGKFLCRKQRSGDSQWSAARPGSSAGRPVPYGRRQLAGSRLGTRRSRNLGCRIHELQRGVAGIESTECATPSGRKAVVPDDCGKAAGPSRTGGPHPDQAPTFSRLPSEPRFE